VDDAENGGVDADPDPQAQDRQQRKARGVTHLPRGLPQILVSLVEQSHTHVTPPSAVSASR
jgi:hypothetical protein